MKAEFPALTHRLCVAPMMNHTDRHFRYLLRLISRRVMLYTEMITTGALIHGRQHHRLAFDPAEHPLALQLGGNDPLDLARCARLAAGAGYDEINLNVGCPSSKVQTGQFGACLMADPSLVAECVAAMTAAVGIPVTVKTRIGIDDRDSYEHLCGFIDTVAGGGCRTFIMHARKAWLQGLSPRQNREVPPLDYPMVYQLKRDYPQLELVINGGINSLEEAKAQLRHVDGVMIGRAACSDPWLFAAADKLIFGDEAAPGDRGEILKAYLDYTGARLAEGIPLQQMSRHLLGLFQGQPGARRWRRHLSEHIHRQDAGIEVIEEALNAVKM